MTITRRLVIVLGLFMLILSARTVFFDQSLTTLRNQVLTVANETLPREEMAEEMVEATNQLALVTTSYAASPHPDLLLEIDTAGQDFT
ncbi:MAG TPA: hypothetical protein VJR05_04480, partial [Acidimicrobiia bacterium]|nr:hypothetical protein [Acidimicrobiia bacterium]